MSIPPISFISFITRSLPVLMILFLYFVPTLSLWKITCGLVTGDCESLRRCCIFSLIDFFVISRYREFLIKPSWCCFFFSCLDENIFVLICPRTGQAGRLRRGVLLSKCQVNTCVFRAIKLVTQLWEHCHIQGQ